MGSAIVPVRIRESVVQIHVESAHMETVVAVATDNGRVVARYTPKGRNLGFSHSLTLVSCFLCSKWLARQGSAIGPGRNRESVAQIHAESAHKETVEAAATDKGIIALTIVKPQAITVICCL